MIETIIIWFIGVLALAYVAMSVVLWVGVWRRPRPGYLTEFPFVSVIVPARNEADNITTCLEHLARQTYPRDRYEIIVVDDRSEDGTGQIVSRLIPQLPVVVRLIRQEFVPENWGPKKHAIKTAIESSSADIIMTTDADTRPERKWLRSMVQYMENADLVAGYSPFDKRDSLAGKILALDTLSLAYLSMGGIGAGIPITCAGRSFGYRRQVFEEIGGFGEAGEFPSGDDSLLLQRAMTRGYRAAFCDKAGSFAWTSPAGNLRRYLNQQVRRFSGGRYMPVSIVILGAVAWLWFALVFGGMLTGFWWAWAAFGVKALADFVSMSVAAQRLHEWRLMIVYPIAAILYLPHFLIFTFLGTFGSSQWKGTKVG